LPCSQEGVIDESKYDWNLYEAYIAGIKEAMDEMQEEARLDKADAMFLND